MERSEQAKSPAPAPALADAETLATRASLLSRLKDLENQSSWQEFFDTYWRLIYATARKAGLTPEEAQDAVQDTCVAVAQNIGEFRYDPARCSFKSWLLLLTRQRIIWQLRKRPPVALSSASLATDTTRTPTVERLPDPGGLALEAIWDAEWQEHLLETALAQVKSKVKSRQYQIFDLVVLQRWSVDDVARTLGLNRAQVYLAKHRVSALLKQAVKRLEQQAGKPPGKPFAS
jgi:RNA polymerase sigma-70 factor (ECF subfamily)